jgi:hypothetical protein
MSKKGKGQKDEEAITPFALSPHQVSENWVAIFSRSSRKSFDQLLGKTGGQCVALCGGWRNNTHIPYLSKYGQ